ncbi:MAG: hypothetical protein M9908_03670 [Phyllobacteriaceae bacterium]|nr:hypothetical protein [Phyllobacteriaceae bacterium]
MARWRRRSPATLMLAILLSLAQVQFALAAIVNTVTVTGQFGGSPITASDSASVDVEDAVPGWNVVKTGILNDDDGTPGISAGDTVSYEITAENTGNVTLTGVSASDPFVALTFDAASDPNSNGTLDVGETWRWTGSYTLQQGDLDTAGGGDNDLDNTATVSSDQLPDAIVSEEVPIVATAELTIVKAGTLNDDDGTAGQSAGDTVDYTVTVQNTGNITVSGVAVADPLVTLAFDGNDAGSDGIITPGETWTYTGSYVLTQADLDSNGGGDGNLDNTVTVSSAELADQTASHSIPLAPAPGISIAKSADITGVSAPGDDVVYTITATNTGNVTLSNVVVTDTVTTPNTITCATLAPQAACVLTGNYTVTAADYINGGVTNTADVTSEEGENDSTTITTPLTASPGLTVSKAVAPASVSAAGAALAYTVTIENTGNVPLTGVDVSDPMIALDCGSGSATIATLAVGATQTCTASYTVTQADMDGSSTLSNTVTVTDDGTYSINETASANVAVVQTPGMTVSKSGTLNDDDGVAGVSAGDTIAYTVSVENTGNVSLTGVTPADPLVTLSLDSGDTDSDSELDPGETWLFTGAYPLTQADIDSDGGGDGNIENTVTVSSDQTPDGNANSDVPLNINPAMEVAKTAVLNDDDGNPGLTAGDTIDYTVTVTNTGNIRLTNVAVSDPYVTLALQSGDTNSDNRLDVGEIWTYGGTTIVTQSDLDTLGGGDGDIDNTATVTSDQLPPQTADHELPIAPVSALEIKKTATVPVQQFPTVFSYDYQLTVRNTGAVTQTGIRISDDVAAAVAPAVLIGTPSAVVSGFAGSGGINGGYDGSSDTQLLVGDVQLAPGDIALVTISVTIDTGARSISGLNTAFTTSGQISVPVASDDPTQTPGDPSDTNPTPDSVPDSDGDGGIDGDEDDTADRDGDGDANEVDYDPTGYFYCQADGRILSGGLITVENLTAGGSQTGLGASNGIVILRDGSDGSYQFHATQPGTYQLSYTLPPDGIASTDRLSAGTTDLTSYLPDNPAVLGSGEFGSTGYLADFTAPANPFYTRFEIEAGDPAVFNNNIPLQYCGSPTIDAAKSVSAGPDVQPDLSSNVQYRLTLTADGDEPVNNVQMVDDLAAVFGAANFTVTGAVIDSAPAGFGASIDPFYDGSANTALLTAGGSLQPSESVSVLLDVNVAAASGIYDNTLVVSGTSPLDGTPVAPSSDNAQVTITSPAGQLTVEKTAVPGRAPLGAPVAYTITVRNGGAIPATGIDVVDLMPNGMSYVPDSARIDGVAGEPEQGDAPGYSNSSGRALIWRGVDIPAGDSVTITLTMAINASASAQEFENLAYGYSPVSGGIVTNIARAKVLLEIEHVFQCSDIIGRVFDDKDKDGYFDDGEPGLPGVRLATPNGLLIVTDKFGRYSIACGAIPDKDIGSNFLLKLDTPTLPTGYRVTSENPRVVRLTQGKLTKLNFAAANLRVIRLEVSDASFAEGSERPMPATVRSLGSLLPLAEEEPSLLRIVYDSPGAGRDLVHRRLEGLQSLINGAWAAKQRRYPLSVETRIVN